MASCGCLTCQAYDDHLDRKAARVMTVVDLYTIQIILEPGPMSMIKDLPALMAEAEENLTDLLPAGYRARIRRWDDLTEGNDDE